MNKRKKGIDPDQSMKKRQSSAKPAKKDLSQDDEKIIKSLEKLIAKQEQLLRSLNLKKKLINTIYLFNLFSIYLSIVLSFAEFGRRHQS